MSGAYHADVVDVLVPRCLQCGSTARTAYEAVKRLEVQHLKPGGEVYTRITWKRTRCLVCGQRRVERHLEHPAADNRQPRQQNRIDKFG